jgi:putative SOS response-associated peptidase YedK
MCGRYTLTSSDQRRLGSRFQISLDDETPGLGRFNVAPTQEVLTVNTDPDSGEREAVASRWGLVPFWGKSKNRCLILADGFYEWLKAENPKEPRQPVRFTVDGGEPFAFAGLTVTRDWEGEPLASCTIITTEANDVVSRVHDRMPVILPNEEVEQAWLTGDLNSEEAVSLCVPLDPKRMEAKPANPILNKVGGSKEGPDFLEAPDKESD